MAMARNWVPNESIDLRIDDLPSKIARIYGCRVAWGLKDCPQGCWGLSKIRGSLKYRSLKHTRKIIMSVSLIFICFPYDSTSILGYTPLSKPPFPGSKHPRPARLRRGSAEKAVCRNTAPSSWSLSFIIDGILGH